MSSSSRPYGSPSNAEVSAFCSEAAKLGLLFEKNRSHAAEPDYESDSPDTTLIQGPESMTEKVITLKVGTNRLADQQNRREIRELLQRHLDGPRTQEIRDLFVALISILIGLMEHLSGRSDGVRPVTTSKLTSDEGDPGNPHCGGEAGRVTTLDTFEVKGAVGEFYTVREGAEKLIL